MKKIILNKGVSLIFQTPNNHSYKFGYYNYAPININGDKLLAHKIYFEGRNPNKNDKVDIGYFSLPDGKWVKITESNAYNWQQGSMLQWIGPTFNEEIVFNDVKNNSYISRIININSNKERQIPKAVYGVSPLGDYSISLHFERCNFTRAYSYSSVENQAWNSPLPENDGVIKINLLTGKWETIIPLKNIVNFSKDSSFDTKSHWIEHIMLNPKGNRFAFYHRYSYGEGFKTRCFTADLNGQNIWLHPNSPLERLSHLGWIDNNRYVIYTAPTSPTLNKVNHPKESNKIGNWLIKKYRAFIKPLVPLPKGFFNKMLNPGSFYSLTIDQKRIIEKLNPEPGGMDGHPSFTRDCKFMLTDTYADQKGYRHLLIYDLENKKTITLGRFFSFYNNCGWRADLHPRFSPDGKYVIIDSTHNKHHQILILALNWEKIT